MSNNKSPWPFNGYAPGNYMNTCTFCKKDMQRVDKLCFVCLECAVIKAKEILESPAPETVEKNGIDLKALEERLDKVLEVETPESYQKWYEERYNTKNGYYCVTCENHSACKEKGCVRQSPSVSAPVEVKAKEYADKNWKVYEQKDKEINYRMEKAYLAGFTASQSSPDDDTLLKEYKSGFIDGSNHAREEYAKGLCYEAWLEVYRINATEDGKPIEHDNEMLRIEFDTWWKKKFPNS
jgi:hypothetical protein